LDNCIEVGDWVIIDDGIVGEVWSMHTTNDIVDVWIERDKGYIVETLRVQHHRLTKITKEVADIIKGV